MIISQQATEAAVRARHPRPFTAGRRSGTDRRRASHQCHPPYSQRTGRRHVHHHHHAGTRTSVAGGHRSWHCAVAPSPPQRRRYRRAWAGPGDCGRPRRRSRLWRHGWLQHDQLGGPLMVTRSSMGLVACLPRMKAGRARVMIDEDRLRAELHSAVEGVDPPPAPPAGRSGYPRNAVWRSVKGRPHRDVVTLGRGLRSGHVGRP